MKKIVNRKKLRQPWKFIHTTAQYEVIQKQQNEYQNRPANKKTSDNKNNNEQASSRYNTRSITRKNGCEVNNNLSTRMSDEASSSSSEINQIDETFLIQDDKIINAKDIISTEVHIQCFSKNLQHLLLGLLDTGARGIFIKREALSKIEHQVKQVNLKVKVGYSQSHLNAFPNLLLLHLFKFFFDGFTPFLSRPWIIMIPSFFKSCRFLFNSSYTNERKVCMVK
jgi:hypothetical protein